MKEVICLRYHDPMRRDTYENILHDKYSSHSTEDKEDKKKGKKEV